MKTVIGKSRVDGSLIYSDLSTSSGKNLSSLKNPWFGLSKSQMVLLTNPSIGKSKLY